MSHGRVASQEWIQYQRRNDTFMSRNHQRTLSTNEIVEGKPKTWNYFWLCKSRQKMKISTSFVWAFIFEVARSESKGGDYDEGASSQEIKISRQLQNFFLSLSLIVLIKMMTRNHVVGGWLRICEARKMKNRLEEKLKNQVFSSLDLFDVMDLSMIWFHLSEWPSCLSNHVESLDIWVRVLVLRGNLVSTIHSE